MSAESFAFWESSVQCQDVIGHCPLVRSGDVTTNDFGVGVDPTSAPKGNDPIRALLGNNTSNCYRVEIYESKLLT